MIDSNEYPQRQDITTTDEPTVRPEIIRGVDYFNLSGQPIGRAISYLPQDLRPSKVIFLPDLCPGRSAIPTGCCVEINMDSDPSWRRFAGGDVGCGMQVIRPKLTWEEFDKTGKGRWANMLKTLATTKGKLGDLGSGNHFIDAVVDSGGEQMYFVIHTGSRDQGQIASRLVNIPHAFDEAYQESVEWARQNRLALADMLMSRFGECEFVLDTTHDFHTQQGGIATIYSGAVRLESNTLSVIPSSLTGNMAIVRGKDGQSRSKVNYAVSHGTGRIASRSEGKSTVTPEMIATLRRKVFIPREIDDSSLRGEHPDLYRPLDDCLELLNDHIQVVDQLTPVAYIGQV